MISEFGVNSMSGKLRKVAIRRPSAILSADNKEWNYSKPLNQEGLLNQYAHFVTLLEAAGAEILWFDDTDDALADSIFTYDPSFMLGSGSVLLRPGKEKRLGEVDVHRRFYERCGIPIIGEIESPGTLEGGDCFWLDEATLAVGKGFRSNDAGISQLRDIVSAEGVEVIQFDLPFYKGPDACLHLMSLVSPLDNDLALVFKPLLPDGLEELMGEFGFDLIEASESEFEESLGLSLNVLATEPRKVIAIHGFPETHRLMIESGCSVSLFNGDELCIPCEGGPTCLTRPILRS